MRSDQTGDYENAYLVNLDKGGMYIMSRRKLSIGQELVIAVPSEKDDDHVEMNVKVIRYGNHRSWGLFSYGCRLLQSS